VNIAHPIDLYEVVAQPTPDWKERCRRYDAALLALEQENWSDAVQSAKRLAADYPQDAAVAALLKRVEAAERTSKLGDTSVWQLPGK
jgi:hypothetical protein